MYLSPVRPISDFEIQSWRTRSINQKSKSIDQLFCSVRDARDWFLVSQQRINRPDETNLREPKMGTPVQTRAPALFVRLIANRFFCYKKCHTYFQKALKYAICIILYKIGINPLASGIIPLHYT